MSVCSVTENSRISLLKSTWANKLAPAKLCTAFIRSFRFEVRRKEASLNTHKDGIATQLIDSFLIHCVRRLYEELDSGWRCSLQHKQLRYIIGSLKLKISVKRAEGKLLHMLSAPIAILVDGYANQFRWEKCFCHLRVVSLFNEMIGLIELKKVCFPNKVLCES